MEVALGELPRVSAQLLEQVRQVNQDVAALNLIQVSADYHRPPTTPITTTKDRLDMTRP